MATPKRQRALRSTKAAKRKKALAASPFAFIISLFIFLALISLLVAIGGYYLRYKLSLLSFEVPPSIQQIHPTNNRPSSLTIHSLSLTTPIQPTMINHGVWTTFAHEASYLTTSAQPLESSNIIIYALPRPGLFEHLNQVKIGDMITLQTTDKKEFEYIVQDVKIVPPSDGEILEPTDHEVLTLFTASGFLHSKRLVVQALPVKTMSF